MHASVLSIYSILILQEYNSVDELSNIEPILNVKEGAGNSPQDQKTSKEDNKFYSLDKDNENMVLHQTDSGCKHGNDVSFSRSEVTGIKYDDRECCLDGHSKQDFDQESLELDEKRHKKMLSPFKGGSRKISDIDNGKVATDGNTLGNLKRPPLERIGDKSQDFTASTSHDRFIDTSDCRSRSRSNCHSRGQSQSRETMEEEAESKRSHHHGWDHAVFDDYARGEGRHQRKDTKDRGRSKMEVDRDWSKENERERKENEREKSNDRDRGIDEHKYDEREKGRSRDRRKEVERNMSRERELDRERRRERDVERDRRVKERGWSREREVERDRRMEKERGWSREKEVDRDRRAEKERCRSTDREGYRDRRRETEKDRSKDKEVDWEGRRDRDRDRNDDNAEYSDRYRDRERVREVQRDRFRDKESDRERRDGRNKNKASDSLSSKDKYGNTEHGFDKVSSKQSRHYNNDSGLDVGRVNAFEKYGSHKRNAHKGGEGKLMR